MQHYFVDSSPCESCFVLVPIRFASQDLASGKPLVILERFVCQQTCFIMTPKTRPKKVVQNTVAIKRPPQKCKGATITPLAHRFQPLEGWYLKTGPFDFIQTARHDSKRDQPLPVKAHKLPMAQPESQNTRFYAKPSEEVLQEFEADSTTFYSAARGSRFWSSKLSMISCNSC